jgi:hypothetical protein
MQAVRCCCRTVHASVRPKTGVDPMRPVQITKTLDDITRHDVSAMELRAERIIFALDAGGMIPVEGKGRELAILFQMMSEKLAKNPDTFMGITLSQHATEIPF